MGKTFKDGIDFSHEKTLTQQQHKNDVDINTIVKRLANGAIPTGTTATPMFADLTNDMSFHDMHNHVKAVQREFGSLNAHIRAKFKGDPQNLINWLADPKNDEEAIELGFKVAPQPTTVPSKEPTKEPVKEVES